MSIKNAHFLFSSLSLVSSGSPQEALGGPLPYLVDHAHVWCTLEVYSVFELEGPAFIILIKWKF